MNPNKIIITCVVGLFALIAINSSSYVVPESMNAVITQMGKPVGVNKEAGLSFKIPFVQEVRLVDVRILSWDGYPNQLTTKDKKYIYVDTTARWKIVDALVFSQSLQTEQAAYSRINNIIDSATRDIVASHNLVETVRNSNEIAVKIEEIKTRKKEKDNTTDVEEEVYSDIEQIEHGREKLADMIKALAEKELSPFGVKLEDVQIRRIAYEESVQKKVFERMISERLRIAEKIRSIGEGESAAIRGKMSKDLNEIESLAYKQVEEIKGEADAISLKTYAKVFSKDPELYAFLKSMDGYKNVFSDKNKEMVISPDSHYFQYMKNQ